MGKNLNRKLVLLSAVFLLTALAILFWQRPAPVVRKPELTEYFRQIGPYSLDRPIPLAQDLTKMLDLDNYLFGVYRHGDSQVTLYVGYYYTAAKAYAAHSPLVCYPSQGWRIEDKPVSRSLAIGDHVVNYQEITTSLGEQRELVLYWYQAGPFTNTQVYRNKVDIGYNKFTRNNEQHAFVRVTVDMKTRTRQEARRIAQDFIRAFYPQFVTFTTI